MFSISETPDLVSTRDGGGVRASAPVHVGQIEIGDAEPGSRPVWTKSVDALLEGLRAPRRLGKQELHYIVDDAIAAEELHLAVAGWIPCCAQARRNLVAPSEID